MYDSANLRTTEISGGLYNDLLAGILMGEYPQHSALPTETRLATDYGVSRAVVRVALEKLKKQGVIQSRQGSGTVVTAVNPQTIANLNRDAQLPQLKDCLACRLAFEPEIAAAVALNCDQRVEAFLLDQRQALKVEIPGTDTELSVRDTEFHVQIADFSRNIFFASIMHDLRPYMLFAMNITKTLSRPAHTAHIDLSRREHLDIITTILDRDAAAARQTMKSHIENGTQRIFQNHTN
jgi:GntR family transcriptional repressor for pyruvate dehydrogenase complex